MRRLSLNSVDVSAHRKYFSEPLMKALGILASSSSDLRINGVRIPKLARDPVARDYFRTLLNVCKKGRFDIPLAKPAQMDALVAADWQFTPKGCKWVRPSGRTRGFTDRKTCSKRQRKIHAVLERLFSYSDFDKGYGWTVKDDDVRTVRMKEAGVSWRAFEFQRQIVEGNRLRMCPYCNAETTFLLVGLNTSTTESRSHLDHFYPKLSFPYLAVSLCNLVPCCAHCNSSSKGGKIPFRNGRSWPHPYADSFHDMARFRYTDDAIASDPLSILYGIPPDDLTVEFDYAKGVSGARAKCFASEMNLLDIYNQAYKKEINQIPSRLQLAMSNSPTMLQDLVDGSIKARSGLIMNCSFDPEAIPEERLSKLTMDLVGHLTGR